MTTGYFSSVVQELSEHVAAFITCPGAQVYWWLKCRGCITADVNKLIRHCFTLSQQQKVSSSKYLKDLGHAVVDTTDGDDIIQASNLEGIFNLSLGLSDKERRSLMTIRGYDAAAIAYGDAKEGSIEAHNFLAALSVTSLRSTKGKAAEEGPGLTPTLAQSVYSIGTSRVTKDSDNESGEEEEDNEGEGNPGHRTIAINGMDMLSGDSKAAMLFSTASMEEARERAQEEKGQMEEDQSADDQSRGTEENEWHNKEREASTLQTNMNTATVQLQLDSDGTGILSSDSKEDSEFQESNMSVRSHELDLSLDDYESNHAQEVSSGEFDATHSKKYVNPTTFRQALWNAAGQSAGAMVTCLGILKDELEGELAGIPAKFKNRPEQLISFLYEEAGAEPNAAINYIIAISAQLSHLDGEESEEGNGSHVKVINYNGEALAEITVNVATGESQDTASKTQGTLPGAQLTSPAERTVTEPATEAGGDKEGVRSMSMATSG
jgi:hypothetical protein